ncbi:transposase [Labilibaculum sp. A4]|uniref:transposase n=1 Tax=Labilibaculum euxinus TaxID=2686357 RepID=UPI000F61E050|nr:transposase [Labilibaculum euxinus]MWN78156.1 transposase [Labilibaculum euxinus]
MAKHYETDFKLMIVNLLKSGQSARQVSEDYGLNANMIRRWLRENLSAKESFTGKGNISLSPEQREIAQLRAELKETKLERDILKKAVSIFSKSDN